ncbi:MAG: sulfatase [Planctomycetota bacterium]
MSPNRPHILIITTHDTGCLFGCYGVAEVHTPAIDRFAAESVQFDRCFTPYPQCSPSRASLYTGLYPQRHGVMGLAHEPFGYNPSDPTRHLSHVMAEAGYRTTLCGLQHEATDPAILGYQAVHRERKPDHQRYPAEDVADAACAVLEGHADDDRPMFISVGFKETHRPFDFGGVGPDTQHGLHIPSFLAGDDPVLRDQLALHQGSIRKADAAVGRILDRLDTLGLTRYTLVVFTVDHGIDFPRAKHTLYRSGLQVPLIVRWPGGGIGAGRRTDRFVGNLDVFPTVVEAAGLNPPDDTDGRTLLPICRSADAPPVRSSLGTVYTPVDRRGMLTERYNLIRNFAPFFANSTPARSTLPPGPSPCVPPVELYDLVSDPGEFHNLANDPDHREVCRSLNDQIRDWLHATEDPILTGPTPSPAWHRAIGQMQESSAP